MKASDNHTRRTSIQMNRKNVSRVYSPPDFRLRLHFRSHHGENGSPMFPSRNGLSLFFTILASLGSAICIHSMCSLLILQYAGRSGTGSGIRRHSLHRTTVRAQLNFRPTATSTSPNLAVRMALIVLCRFLKIRNWFILSFFINI